MGRDVAGLCIDKKPINVTKSNAINQLKAQVAPKATVERVEANGSVADDLNAKGIDIEGGHEKQDVLAVKSTNYENALPDAKVQKLETLKTNEKRLISPSKPASASTVTETLQTSPPVPIKPSLSPEKQNTGSNDVNGTESIIGTVKSSSLNSPTARISELMSPVQSRTTMQHDDEDNLSLASSAATSVRTIKSRVTVPVAPSFVCVERAERRKEFYTKLDEKHKALEKEKLEYAARTEEEEAAAIKQLRKSMVYKANPVPSFYREGPPPKVELKKLPVTRAKSPNLTRRKSCSDATKSAPEDKGVCARAKRHSIGVYKEGCNSPTTPKNKDVTGRRNSITGVSREGSFTPAIMKSKSTLSRQSRTEVKAPRECPKSVKEASKASRPKDQAGADVDISVVPEVTKTPATLEHIADISVVQVTNISHEMADEMGTGITVSEEVKIPPPKVAEQKSSDIAVETSD